MYNPEEDFEEQDNNQSHSQQVWSDLSDAVNSKLERGEIDEEQAAEMRMGA